MQLLYVDEEIKGHLIVKEAGTYSRPLIDREDYIRSFSWHKCKQFSCIRQGNCEKTPIQR